MHLFSIGLLIGIYSYIIFALGLAGILYTETVLFCSLVFILAIFIFRKKIFPQFKHQQLGHGKTPYVFGVIIVLQALINLLGVFGPELSFDALWYHLTLPKIFIEQHAIVFIPGSLLYYSAMPKLTEMLYTAALLLGTTTLAKGIHFFFGILITIALYSFTKRHMSHFFAGLSALIFYSNLVVGWESITAYVDLARTFFEFMAVWGIVLWVTTQEKKWLIEAALLLGLAITVKLLALGSLILFCCLFLFARFYLHYTIVTLRHVFLFLICAVAVPFPWFVFSYLHTGSPIYPFFSNMYPVTPDINLLNVKLMVTSFYTVFLNSPDPISPLYLIFLPCLVLVWKTLSKEMQLLASYACSALVLWYITPHYGGGRFILPYLPVLSILVVVILQHLQFSKRTQQLLLTMMLLVSASSIMYRGIANAKFIPYVFGRESKTAFLEKHLHFHFGEFYDTDAFFQRTLRKDDVVLLYGFHNLYYVNFPFIHETWVKKGNTFTYIATQHTTLPKRFSYWPKVYENTVTGVSVYSMGGQKWVY
jgi:hypothetical protein